jgi:hypothetical protein
MLNMAGSEMLFAAAGNLYFLLALAGICFALWIGTTWTRKLVYGGVVLALFISPIAPEMYRAIEYRGKLATAQALFDERCKTAGERIYKTVENVEEVLLVNVRPHEVNADRANRDWLGAGFPGESGGNQYIMEFLYFNKPRNGLQGRSLGPTPGGVKGYRHVFVDEQGARIRYTLRDEAQYSAGGDPVKGYGLRDASNTQAPRYSISYENIHDPDGRKLWIAGGLVKITDQSSGELLAEFKRFSFETSFGSTNGERSPWAFAIQCPQSTYGGSSGHIRSFVEQVLKPK